MPTSTSARCAAVAFTSAIFWRSASCARSTAGVPPGGSLRALCEGMIVRGRRTSIRCTTSGTWGRHRIKPFDRSSAAKASVMAGGAKGVGTLMRSMSALHTMRAVPGSRAAGLAIPMTLRTKIVTCFLTPRASKRAASCGSAAAGGPIDGRGEDGAQPRHQHRPSSCREAWQPTAWRTTCVR